VPVIESPDPRNIVMLVRDDAEPSLALTVITALLALLRKVGPMVADRPSAARVIPESGTTAGLLVETVTVTGSPAGSLIGR